jgi:hypothetical protein
MTASNRFKSLLFPSVAPALFLFFFNPSSNFTANSVNFSFGFFPLLGLWSFALIGMIAVTAVLGFLIPSKLFKAYVAILIGLGFLVYFQYSFIAWNYGHLDGSQIAWNEHTWKGVVDGTIWLTALTAAVFYRDRIFARAKLISLILILLGTLGLGVNLARHPLSQWVRTPDASNEPSARLFELSPQTNIIHLILDAFEYDAFARAIKRDPSLETELDGFTVFDDALTSYGFTTFSLANIFSGGDQVERPTEADFRKIETEIYEKKSFHRILRQQGFDVHVVTSMNGPKPSTDVDNAYHIRPRLLQQRQKEATQLITLSLFRSVPHVFRRRIITRENQIGRFLVGKQDLTVDFLLHLQFFKDYIGQLRLGKREKSFHFMHTIGTHLPFYVDGECNVTTGEKLTGTLDHYVDAAECNLRHVVALVHKLKTLGVYDRAMIIIHGDHGLGIPKNGDEFFWPEITRRAAKNEIWPFLFSRAAPLLLIKPPGAKSGLQHSSAPALLSDIPATLFQTMKISALFPGRSLFQMKDTETRTRFTVPIPEWVADHTVIRYSVTGRVSNPASWKYISRQSYRPLN